MYSYDRRAKVVTANMSLPDYYWSWWQKAHDQARKLENGAALKALKEAKHFLSELGLGLDIGRSSLETYRSGSDSWGHSVYLSLTDLWDRGAVLTEDVIRMSVFDACRFEPKKVQLLSSGVWVVEAEWGG